MPKASARANARKSAIRARVEHVFAHQKNRFGLFIRTLKRAEAKLTLANLAYNMDRLIFHDRRATAVRPECGFRRKKRPATAICGEKNAVSKNHNWPQQGINPELIRVSSWTPVLTWRDERFCDVVFFYAFLREWDMERRGFFSLSEHLDQISKDALEVLEATFDYFRGSRVWGMAMARKVVARPLIRCPCSRR